MQAAPAEINPHAAGTQDLPTGAYLAVTPETAISDEIKQHIDGPDRYADAASSVPRFGIAWGADDCIHIGRQDPMGVTSRRQQL